MNLTDRLSCNISNVTLAEWIVAGAIISVTFILRKFLARRVISILSQTNANDMHLKISIIESVFKPISYTIVIFGIYVANIVTSLSVTWHNNVENLLRILLTLIFFWGAFNVLVPLFFYLQHNQNKKALRQEFYYFMFRMSRILIIILGIITALEMWGVNVFAFIAGLGLVGAAVAFAAQDTLKNIFASLSLLIEETFYQGETIKTKDVEGVVEHIGFRKTSIRQADKSLVAVPNSSLTDSHVINLSRMNMRQIKFMIELDHNTSVDQLRAVTQNLRESILSNSDIETNPKKAAVIVFVSSLTAYSIKISCECYTKTNNYVEFCKIKEELLLALVNIVKECGINFAVKSPYIVMDKNVLSSSFLLG